MRILIAEDDALLREGLALLLRGEGFEVSAVSDAAQFLTVFEETPPTPRCSTSGCLLLSPTKDFERRSRCASFARAFPSWSFPLTSRIVTPVNCWQEALAGSGTCSRNESEGSRVRRRIEPGRRRWNGDGSRGRIPTDEPSTRRRSDQIADSTRVRSSRTDGGGVGKSGNRQETGRQRHCCEQAHRKYLRKTRPVGFRKRASSCFGSSSSFARLIMDLDYIPDRSVM